MSGHSKWNNIKRTKEKSDALKGKVFTKLGREIAVIVKQGGADPNTNAKLKDVIAKAKQSNMPNESIQRSIKKASGELSGINYEAITYEGYGVGGSAVIVSCLTDNKNRTAGDVRHAFDKYNGSLGSTGCVSYLFNHQGIVVVEKTADLDVDTVMMVALDGGAKDIIEEDDILEIKTDPEEASKVAEYLENNGIKVESFEKALVPDMYVDLDEKQLTSFLKMVDALEDLDDVQEVSHNVNLPDEIED